MHDLVINFKYLTVFTSFGFLFWLTSISLLFAIGVNLSNKSNRIANTKLTIRDSMYEFKKIKKFYRFSLEASALIYYLFLPLPIFIIIIISGILILQLERLNILNPVILGSILCIVIIMISAIIKSLLLKHPSIPEELKLKRKDAPLLFQICDEISTYLELDPINSIYLDHDSNISVFEDGTIKQHFTGQSKKCLIIGIGALKNMTISQLKSILGHEFGHIYNKDTFGGSFALFVRRNIKEAMKIIETDLMNRWYNPAWVYISLFNKVFLRISQGAARLQELLADEISAYLFGSDLFSNSLLSFTKNQIEFSVIKKIGLMNALNNNEEPDNIYLQGIPSVWPEDVKYSYGYIYMSFNHSSTFDKPIDFIEHEFKIENTLDTDLFDSHPSLKERLSHLDKIGTSSQLVDHKSALTLIPEISYYQKMFTKALFEQIVSKMDYLTDLEYEKRLNRN